MAVKPAVIIGAGVSGLCAGALLARDGYPVAIYEKDGRVGGRTASAPYKNHTLDNGFHIMPFYKKSALYDILQKTGTHNSVSLVTVSDIAFHSNGSFHLYPTGISDIIKFTMVPFRSRLSLLRLLLPMAFSTMKGAEALDSVPLSSVTSRLDSHARAFFDAVCMLAFADVPGRVSLGEFVRTIMRANPFRGGTSRFAYPGGGGYDSICGALASYITGRGGKVHLSGAVRGIRASDGAVDGVIDASGNFIESDCVVVSVPAYQAANLLERGVLEKETVSRMRRLNDTTSVVEVHYATNRRIDKRQIVFPVGEHTAKGIFFTSNISPNLCPPGEHQIISGAPVDASTAGSGSAVRRIAGEMRRDIESIYPGFADRIVWERPRAWQMVEAVVKKPGMVWRSKMPHSIPEIRGLFFVGDSTISYGIGTDSAAHSALLCHPMVAGHMRARAGAP